MESYAFEGTLRGRNAPSRKARCLVPEVRVFSGGTAWMGGGDAISVQAEGREDDRGGTEEGGETVKPGAVGGGGGMLWGNGPVGTHSDRLYAWWQHPA